MRNHKKFQEIWNLCKGKTVCVLDENNPDSGCGQRQPNYRLEVMRLFATFKAAKDSDGNIIEERKIEMTPEKTLALFRSISDQDCELMGINPKQARPDWLIITVLPVPPMPVRPSVLMDGTRRSEDDLTHKLADIIKVNAGLRKHEADGAPNHIISEFEQLLQWHVATMMNNEMAGIPQAMQKSGRPVFLCLI
jgi:DNA-directed RNA polymerase II subunit RPB1